MNVCNVIKSESNEFYKETIHTKILHLLRSAAVDRDEVIVSQNTHEIQILTISYC